VPRHNDNRAHLGTDMPRISVKQSQLQAAGHHIGAYHPEHCRP
jgi:hypothetical protein